MNRRLIFSIAATLLVPCASLGAQSPTQASIVFPRDMGRTGVFRLTLTDPELQVQVRSLTADGEVATSPGCVATWKSANPEVLAVVRSNDYGGFVKPVSEGITELAVTYPCAPGLSRTVPVVVGSTAIDKPFAATGTEASYYPAKLQITPPGNMYISAGRVYLRPIDQEAQFVASAFNGQEGRITPAEFPMKWSVANPGVLAIAKQYDHTVFLNPVGTGTTTVTFTVEGLSQSFDITVQDAKPSSSEPLATLATRNLTIAPVRSVSITTAGSTAVAGGTGTTTNLPIAIRPAPGTTTNLPIAIRPAPGTTITSLPTAITPAPGTASTDSRSVTGESLTVPATPAPPVPTIAPIGPVQAEAAGLVIVRTRSVTAPALTIVGTAIQSPTRSITTPSLSLLGMAIQMPTRSITTSPLVLQGY